MQNEAQSNRKYKWLKDPENKGRRFNIRDPERDNNENREKVILKEVKTKNCLGWMKDTTPQIHRIQQNIKQFK